MRGRALLPVLLCVSLGLSLPSAPSPEERLLEARREIARLRAEAAALTGRERGLLGELHRLDAEHALKQAELQEVEARLERTQGALAAGVARLALLRASRADRARYLGFRLREIYKRGPGGPLRRALIGEDQARHLRGLRYAVLLSERDARTLRAHRRDTAAAARERRLLEEERARLAPLHAELQAAGAALAAVRAGKARFLADVRRDRGKVEAALTELELASRDLARLLEAEGGVVPTLDPRGLRGMLDWPLPGKVTAGFGRTVDPRFGTAVPHPGLDLEGAAGTPFRAVLEGTVLWSGPLRGYGLTAIVDHGSGVASVYAHAAGLVVEKGERVARGQVLGHVGETGGARSPYLYFELREAGKPVDPEGWLRPRR